MSTNVRPDPDAPVNRPSDFNGPPSLRDYDARLAVRIDDYLRGKRSPLAGRGGTFVRAGRTHLVDPLFLVAIAGSETDFGGYGPSQAIHNPFGLGPGMRFGSWDAAILYAAQNLAGPLYAGRDTIATIGARWAPVGASNDPRNLNTNWTRNVGDYYAELAGSAPPDGRVKRRPGQPPLPWEGPTIGTTTDAVRSGAADAAGAVGGAVADAAGGVLGPLVDFLRGIGLRAVAVILGGAAMILGVLALLRSMGAGVPLPTPRTAARRPPTAA